MSGAPADKGSDRNPDSMHEQLRKEAASWSSGRSDETARSAEEFRVPATVPAVRRVSKAKAVPSAVPEAKPAVAAKKPFSMSYDGVTTREHIAYRISRGAR